MLDTEVKSAGDRPQQRVSPRRSVKTAFSACGCIFGVGIAAHHKLWPCENDEDQSRRALLLAVVEVVIGLCLDRYHFGKADYAKSGAFKVSASYIPIVPKIQGRAVRQPKAASS
jgi:hypothetical protein